MQMPMFQDESLTETLSIEDGLHLLPEYGQGGCSSSSHRHVVCRRIMRGAKHTITFWGYVPTGKPEGSEGRLEPVIMNIPVSLPTIFPVGFHDVRTISG